MKDNRKTIQLLLIFTVIFSVIGGSLAYWNWNTTEAEQTNVVFTVTSDFSCAADGGGNITSNDVSLAPTTCTDTSRAIKRKVTVTPTLNRETMTLSMDLWLTINDLGEGLKKSNNFRYVLTTSSNSCEEGTIMASGNFKGRKEGNKVNLLTNELYVDTSIVPEEYWLYIWLDEEETSSSTMNQTFSLSLGGQCEEVETLVGDAYAVITTTPDTLTFTRSTVPITVGDMYNGKEVTEVYTGFEDTEYTSVTQVPWSSYSSLSIKFEDIIMPVSTAYWFCGSNVVPASYGFENLEFLKTSRVTNMSHMFADIAWGDPNLDLSHFDTSNVTDMSYMFYDYVDWSDVTLDLSSWDTSSVKNMKGMFYHLNTSGEDYNYTKLIGLENWDLSNVTDMSYMFSELGGNSNVNIGNITNWNVSNVADMSNMFSNVSLASTLDLSNWDVSSVNEFEEFSDSDNIISPFVKFSLDGSYGMYLGYYYVKKGTTWGEFVLEHGGRVLDAEEYGDSYVQMLFEYSYGIVFPLDGTVRFDSDWGAARSYDVIEAGHYINGG